MDSQKVCLLFKKKKKIKHIVYISFGIAFQRLTQNQISLFQAVKKKFFFNPLCVLTGHLTLIRVLMDS